MSRKSIKLFEAAKGQSEESKILEIRHQATLKIEHAKRLLTEALALQAIADEMEENQ